MEYAVKIENVSVDVEQELYIKEEVVISDMSDFIENESDDDNDMSPKQNDLFGNLKKSNNQLPPEENIKAGRPTEKNKCGTCGVTFKYWSILQRHQPVCRLAPFLKCDFCDYKTRHSHCLRTHSERMHRNLKAEVKQKIFDKARAKELKLLKKASVRTSKFNWKNLVKEENVKTENRTGKYECTKCGAKFEHTRNLNIHRKVCGVTPFLKCDFCVFKTKYLRSMMVHLQRRHTEVKAGEIQKSIDKARKKHTEILGNAAKNSNYKSELDWKNLVKLYCSKCNVDLEVISLSDQLCPHCREAALVQCLKCGKGYLNINSMYYHLRSRCGPKEYFQCEDCNYRATFKSRLIEHIRSKHTTVAPEDYVMCTRCGQSFKHRVYRQNHEKLCVKCHQCKLCPFKSKRKDLFEKHMQNHTMHQENVDASVNEDSMDGATNDGVEITEIQVSNKKVNNQLPLGDDIETKPATEKNRCIKCRGWFKGRYNFKRHQNLCGLSPFLKCEFCYFKTKQTSFLKIHLMRTHKDVKPEDIQKNIDTARMNEHKMFGIKAKPKTTFSTRNHAELYCSTCEINFKGKTSRDRRCPQCCEFALLQCLKCDKRYASRNGMYQHITLKCWPRKYVQCADCDYRSVIKTELMYHIQMVHMTKAPEGYKKCGTCGNGTYGKKPDLQCEFCLLKSKLKSNGTKHARNDRLHPDKDATVDVGLINETAGADEILDDEDRSNIEYYLHERNTNVKRQQVESNNSSDNDIINYQQESYIKEEVMISDVSDFSENEVSMPEGNIETKHTTEQYKCTKCGDRLKGKYKFQRHQSLCGLVPFLTCDFCDYRTKSRNNLTRHSRCIHKHLEVEEIQENSDKAKAKEQIFVVKATTDNSDEITESNQRAKIKETAVQNSNVPADNSTKQSQAQSREGRSRKTPLRLKDYVLN